MDALSSAATSARLKAVQNIRGKVTEVAGGFLTDCECVQAAIATSLRDADELLGALFNRSTARTLVAHTDDLKISSIEWEALFGPLAKPISDQALAAVAVEEDFQTTSRRLGSALRCTIGEAAESRTWARLLTRGSVLLAAHLDENNEEFMELALGTVVKADSRRLEELRAELEDEDMPLLTISNLIVALARAVTSG